MSVQSVGSATLTTPVAPASNSRYVLAALAIPVSVAILAHYEYYTPIVAGAIVGPLCYVVHEAAAKIYKVARPKIARLINATPNEELRDPTTKDAALIVVQAQSAEERRKLQKQWEEAKALEQSCLAARGSGRPLPPDVQRKANQVLEAVQSKPTDKKVELLHTERRYDKTLSPKQLVEALVKDYEKLVWEKRYGGPRRGIKISGWQEGTDKAIAEIQKAVLKREQNREFDPGTAKQVVDALRKEYPTTG